MANGVLTLGYLQNGQDILDNLSDLKPMLLEHHERWVKLHPNGERTPEPRQSRTYDHEHREVSRQHSQRQPERRYEERPRGKERDHQRDIQEQRRVAAEEMARHNEEARLQREAEERERQQAAARGPAATPDRRKESAAMAAARNAAGQPQSAGVDYTFSRPPNGGRSRTPVPDPRQQQDDYSRHQQQQEEMRQREEEITRKREQKRRQEQRQEQDGIVRRQKEADEAARAVRHNITVNNTSLAVDHTPSSLSSTPSMSYSTSTASSSLASTPSSSFYATTPTQAAYTPGLQPPIAVKSRPPSFVGRFDDVPSIMPLESPTRYEGDSTDSESVTTNGTHDWRRAGKQKQLIENSRTPTRAPVRRCVPYTCNLTRLNLTFILIIFLTPGIDATLHVARRILLQ